MQSALHRTDRQRLVSTWVERDLAEQLDQAARDAERSRSAELRIAIREHLERKQDEP